MHVVSALVEGNSILSTVRITGVAKNTILKLLVDLGRECEEYQDRILHDLPCKYVQVDEIWSFCYAKQKNVPKGKEGLGYGNVWTWVALDTETKLVPTWLVSTRSAEAAVEFVSDLCKRLRSRIQLTTDGYLGYEDAVERAFGGEVDYAQLVKIYGKVKASLPQTCIGTQKTVFSGKPDNRRISTSLVERQNLTMRMRMRRFTRSTNGFSKKIENHAAAVALHFMYYNFCQIHKSLRITPAMAAGVSDHLWEIENLIELLEKKESN